MSVSTIRKHIWLIEKLANSHRGMTYNEINVAWQHATHVNPEEEDLPVRTFNNWKKKIFDDFGIKLHCNRTSKAYTIEQVEDIRQGSIYEWLLNAFTVTNMLAERDAMEGRVILEHVPSGQQFLKTIVDAMKENYRLVITYKKFESSEAYETEVEPYFVQLYQRRWYVICRNVERKAMRTYALDRVQEVNVLDTKFKMPRNFDAAAFHTDCYGITRLEGEDPINVKLMVNAVQCDYLRTLKLHHTQQEVETTDDYSIFTLRVYPTFDFLQAILALGVHTKVLEPKWFAKEVGKYIFTMGDVYSEYWDDYINDLKGEENIEDEQL